MRIGMVYVLCTVAACGFQVSPGSGAPGDGRLDAPADAPHDAGGGDDAPDAPTDGPIVAGTMCMMKWMNHTVTLSAPVLLAAQSTTGNDRDPFVTHDHFKLYWQSDVNGDSNIYIATRGSTSAPFGAPSLVTELNTSDDEGRATLTDDGKVVIWASTATNSSASDVDLWQATRSSTANAFGSKTRMPFLDSNPNLSIDDGNPQRDPELTGDGKHVYFSNGNPQKIVEASRGDSTGSFGTPVDIINSGSGDADPSVSGDQKLLLFTSSRGGGAGATDIWYATRGGAGDPFDAALLVPTINSSTFDGDPALSPDGCTVYFASSRLNNQYDLYYAVVL